MFNSWENEKIIYSQKILYNILEEIYMSKVEPKQSSRWRVIKQEI